MIRFLLPPSETKAAGGVFGTNLDLASLSFPALTAPRERLSAALVALSADVPASLAALKLGPRGAPEVERNRELLTSPVLPALERYDGVLFDAMGVAELTAEQRRVLDETVTIVSALFGVVTATDRIPAYRVSASSRIPGISLRSLWRDGVRGALSELAEGSVLIDARSGSYASLAPAPAGAVTLAVVHPAAGPDGRRPTISHANKLHKGELLAAVARNGRVPQSIDELCEIAAAGGFDLEQVSPTRLELVIE